MRLIAARSASAWSNSGPDLRMTPSFHPSELGCRHGRAVDLQLVFPGSEDPESQSDRGNIDASGTSKARPAKAEASVIDHLEAQAASGFFDIETLWSPSWSTILPSLSEDELGKTRPAILTELRC